MSERYTTLRSYHWAVVDVRCDDRPNVGTMDIQENIRALGQQTLKLEQRAPITAASASHLSDAYYGWMWFCHSVGKIRHHA